MKSIFDGYLTPECAKCEDWLDGSDPEKGYGCGCHHPIDLCPHFSKMKKEEEEGKRKD